MYYVHLTVLVLAGGYVRWVSAGVLDAFVKLKHGFLVPRAQCTDCISPVVQPRGACPICRASLVQTQLLQIMCAQPLP
jgi:hypothetical protein